MHCYRVRFPNDDIFRAVRLHFKTLHTYHAQCSLVVFKNNARTPHLWIAAPTFPTSVYIPFVM